MSKQMKQVTSSNIRAIGHDGEDMEIEFNNGSIYLYHDVPVTVYEQFLDSESIGKFFHQNIRDVYTARKIE